MNIPLYIPTIARRRIGQSRTSIRTATMCISKDQSGNNKFLYQINQRFPTWGIPKPKNFINPYTLSLTCALRGRHFYIFQFG